MVREVWRRGDLPLCTFEVVYFILRIFNMPSGNFGWRSSIMIRGIFDGLELSFADERVYYAAAVSTER